MFSQLFQLAIKLGPSLAKVLPFILNFLNKKQEAASAPADSVIVDNKQEVIVDPIVEVVQEQHNQKQELIINSDHEILSIENFKDILRETIRWCKPAAVEKNVDEISLKFHQSLNDSMKRYKIDSSVRASHFFAQILHESGSFKYTEEIATGAAYEWRKDLGNTSAGDGVKFKGRGLIQLTGKFNYDLIGKEFGEDFITGDNHKKLAEPHWASLSAAWFWNYKKDKFGKNLNDFADNNDFIKITYFVNGGFNGFADRLHNLKIAYTVFGVDNVNERLNRIFKEIEDNINAKERTTNKAKALYKSFSTIESLEKLKKIIGA